jgi:hypothetical protein
MNHGTTDNPVILFGVVDFRNQRTNFGIKMDDRRKHVYVIGKSGMGKSELLKNLAIQDIQEGRGLAFIDPHGDPVEDLLDYIPPERINDVIYINPSDMQYPISFNVMEHVDYDQRHLVADGLMAVFKKIWVDQWSARMEYILNYTVLALLEAPGSTLLGINRMMSEKEYRKTIVDQVKDSEVKAFWTQEFAKYNDRYAQEATAAIQNKIGQFVSNPLIRNIIGQPQSSFNIRKAIDEKKIFLVNISKGRIGEDASRLLGAMLITRIQLAAMSRVDVPKDQRPDFALVVDEFQNFATAAFANILSEARKFNLSLIVAHQYVNQMSEEVRDAIFGNVGTLIAFRVGAEDAELLEKEFAPVFAAQDIVNLGKRQVYLKLMIDGIASNAFAATTMDTFQPLEQSTRTQVIDASRATYGRPRDEVEQAITLWRTPIDPPERPRREAPPHNPRPSSGPRRVASAEEGHSRTDDRSQRENRFRSNTRSGNDSGGLRRDSGGQVVPPKPGESEGDRQRRPPRQQARPRQDRNDERTRDDHSVQKTSPQPSMSLDALKGSGGAVDFQGRPIEKKDENDKATLTSVDLRTMIAKALMKE